MFTVLVIVFVRTYILRGDVIFELETQKVNETTHIERDETVGIYFYLQLAWSRECIL